MIGYYVHHHGVGHLSRARAIAARLAGDVTGISSAARPAHWPGDWLQVADDAPCGAAGDDPTAGGALHWVPLGHAGLRSRMAAVAQWLDAVRPRAVVVDVSVEVALLCRLHGVPVAVVLQPGERSDPAHDLVYRIADRLIAPWPADLHPWRSSVDPHDPRLHHVGAISRHDGRDPAVVPHDRAASHVVVLNGAGGDPLLDGDDLVAARQATPGWRWTVLGGPGGRWQDDPWPVLCSADVVVTHAGQNAVAEVAAARRPAVVVARDRPHDEQHHLVRALQADDRWPVVALEHPPPTGAWASLLERQAGRDGQTWWTFNDGSGAERVVELVRREALA